MLSSRKSWLGAVMHNNRTALIFSRVYRCVRLRGVKCIWMHSYSTENTWASWLRCKMAAWLRPDRWCRFPSLGHHMSSKGQRKIPLPPVFLCAGRVIVHRLFSDVGYCTAEVYILFLDKRKGCTILAFSGNPKQEMFLFLFRQTKQILYLYISMFVFFFLINLHIKYSCHTTALCKTLGYTQPWA